MKLDMSAGKGGNELEFAPRCKTLFVQCSGVGWLCRARQRLINATHIHWESEGQMTTQENIQNDSDAYPKESTT